MPDHPDNAASIIPTCTPCGRKYGEWPMRPADVPTVPICGPCIHRIREKGGQDALDSYRRIHGYYDGFRRIGLANA